MEYCSKRKGDIADRQYMLQRVMDELLSNLVFEESFLNDGPVEFPFFYQINRLSILELNPSYYISKQFESSQSAPFFLSALTEFIDHG